MNRFLKNWRASGRGEAYRAWIVTYADDFVNLGRGAAAEALAWVDGAAWARPERGQNLRNARQERFDVPGNPAP